MTLTFFLYTETTEKGIIDSIPLNLYNHLSIYTNCNETSENDRMDYFYLP